MRIRRTRDRDRLARFFRRAERAHVYALADLEPPFWPQVDAWIAEEEGEARAAALLVHALAPPMLYAVSPANDPYAGALLESIAPELPERCYANLGAGAAERLGRPFASAGPHWKLGLRREAPPSAPASAGLALLGPADAAELRAFYARAYAPGDRGGGFFLDAMLERGPYVGVRERGALVAAGGVHVVSEARGVAAIGNVATLPERRGRGLGRLVTAEVLRRLPPAIRSVGLNVHEANAAARACYARLGFEAVLPYEEGVLGSRSA